MCFSSRNQTFYLGPLELGTWEDKVAAQLCFRGPGRGHPEAQGPFAMQAAAALPRAPAPSQPSRKFLAFPAGASSAVAPGSFSPASPGTGALPRTPSAPRSGRSARDPRAPLLPPRLPRAAFPAHRPPSFSLLALGLRENIPSSSLEEAPPASVTWPCLPQSRPIPSGSSSHPPAPASACSSSSRPAPRSRRPPGRRVPGGGSRRLTVPRGGAMMRGHRLRAA